MAKEHLQSNKPCLQAVFQEDALFVLSPGNVICESLHLDILTPGYRVEVIEESANL